MTTKFDIIKLKAQAAIGNTEAIYELGYNYLYGIGVEPDIEKAHEYLEKASNKGFTAAKVLVSNVFADNGHSTEINEVFKGKAYEAIKSICQNADKGDPEALLLKAIGKLDDDTEDYRFFRAVDDLKKASQQGYAPALYELGRVYHSAKRISGKESEGLSMIRQAADKEFVPAIKYMMSVSPKAVYGVIRRMAEKPDAEGEILQMLAQYYREGIVVEKDIDKSIDLLKKSADKGCGYASSDLGVIYELGKFGVQKDIDKAIAYFEKGVSQGDTNCMLELGFLLEQSEDCPHDYKRAFELYKNASELNNPGAFNNVGTCYKKGIGTEQNAEKAVACYEKAVEMGSPEAYWNLYLYYMDGVCEERSYTKAVEWLRKGDEAGLLQCTYQLSLHIMNGDGIEKNPQSYFHYVQKAALGGYKNAFVSLGNCYRHGIGTEPNGNMAFDWYKKAAEFSLEGLSMLGQCYTYGIGTQRDDKKAFEIYKKAAEEGSAQAQFDLAICYRHGEGVETNPRLAIEWYQKAADQGHGDALCNLGIMYEAGIGVERNLPAAFGFYRKSAEAGSVQGQFCLGAAYFSGKGTGQDYQEAVKWFTLAAEKGEPDSMYHLAFCYNDGLGVEKDPKIATSLLCAAAERGFQPAIDIINKNKASR